MTQEADTGGTPAVGNVLGFSLLLRDRKALVRLQDRALGPGVRLVEYEAEVPNVVFPLQAPLSAAAFRHRRCRPHRIAIAVEQRALASWLVARLVGRELGGISIERVGLELAARPDTDGPTSIALTVDGRGKRGEMAWLLLALQAVPRGRAIELVPWRAWAFGAHDTAALWPELAARIGARKRRAITVDPLREPLVNAFVRAGWKAPRLDEVGIAALSIDASKCIVRFIAGASDTARPVPARVPALDEDAIGSAAAAARAMAAAHRIDDAIAEVERIADGLAHLPIARVAALRWLVELARSGARPDVAQAALRRWLAIAPADARARRLYAVALAAAGDVQELEARLEAGSALPAHPRAAVRRDLARAALRLRAGDLVGARSLATRAVDRVLGDESLADLRSEALSVRAHAEADVPSVAIATLERALADVVEPSRRAALRAALAERFVALGRRAEAVELARAACDEHPDEETLALAAELASSAGNPDEAIALMRRRVAMAPDRSGTLRRRMIALLAERDPDAALVEVRAALELEPDDAILLDHAVALEHDEDGRLALMRRRLAIATTDAERAELGLALARRLLDHGRPTDAWVVIEPLLEIDAGPFDRELMAVGVTVAPSNMREVLLDRLIAIDAGELAGRALIDRAQRSPSLSQQRRDLWRASEVLEDPRPALDLLVEISDADDAAAHLALADACAGRSDVAGEVRARTELAMRLWATGRAQRAAIALSRVARLRPADLELRLALGVALARSGRAREALEALERVLAARATAEAPATIEVDPRLGFSASPGAIELVAGRLHAELGQHERAIDLLRQALAEAPVGSEERAEATVELALVLSTSGHEVEGREQAREELRRRGEDASAPRLQRIAALERRLALRSPATLDEDVATARELLSLAPDHVDALLLVAAAAATAGDRDEAQRRYARALALLAGDDPRSVEPCLAIARAALEADDRVRARAMLERALPLAPDPGPALELLGRIAELEGDHRLALESVEHRLGRADTTPERVRLLLEVARHRSSLGQAAAAVGACAEAAAAAEPRSDAHREAARAWVELARNDAEEEARARAELRRACAGELAIDDLRAEALLWTQRLADPGHALELLEDALVAAPEQSLLLSTYKEIALAAGYPERYLGVLDRAATDMSPGESRDRLLLELATVAAEMSAAQACLEAVDRLSTTGAAAVDALDLRDWSVRQLGREQAELHAIGDVLLAAPRDATAHARLRRLLPDADARAETLLGLASSRDDEVGRALAAAALRDARDARDPALLQRALRLAIERRADEEATAAWDAARATAMAERDDAVLAGLVMLADVAAENGLVPVAQRGEALLEDALTAVPGSERLHAALWSRISTQADDPDRRLEIAIELLDEISRRRALFGSARAALHVGCAGLLDRRRAARLIAARAQRELEDDEAFGPLVDALVDGEHWPEVIRLLELRAAAVREPAAKVAALKRLAHLCADSLSDPASAIRYLEAAIEIDPNDPDLLLPLLDHHFAVRDLERAIALSERALEHVRMGDLAFTALAHRAADAALARNDPERAAALLRHALRRMPDDLRTRQRLTETEGLFSSPEHRVRMLATVADRHGGSARWEALEERARLLEAMGRLDEAIDDLEAVVGEAADRPGTGETLASLYERRERWSDLADHLQRTFPRQRGPARWATLRRLAEVHADRLLDLGRAEQALRTALDHVGTPPESADAAEDIRRALIDNLERQGRYVDLAVYLERALAPELEDEEPPPDVHPVRLELVARLARIQLEVLDDEVKATRIYERLERMGRLPDEGLAALARAYRRQRRHEDLVRVLNLRARSLAEAGEHDRKASVDLLIAELLEGPLGRPHEAAAYYLDAFLAAPAEHAAAGVRARVLLGSTDAVANVHRRLTERLERLDESRHPDLLALLGDVLTPHEEFAEAAEAVYHRALALAPEHLAANAGLGRMLARASRHAEAVVPLRRAVMHPDGDPVRAADDAALVARSLQQLDRADEAEQVLRAALGRAPDAQRALLELARLYERTGRRADLSSTLDALAILPVPSTVRAEIAHRRAQILLADDADPCATAGERALAQLLEAVGADPGNVAVRQALRDLAHKRADWSIVVQVLVMTVIDLPPGPARAIVQLDLAETHLDQLGDVDAALRNLESAVQQAGADPVVANRCAAIVVRMPISAAARLEQLAGSDADLDDAARARLWMLAGDLRMRAADSAAATTAARRVLELSDAPDELTASASKRIEELAEPGAQRQRPRPRKPRRPTPLLAAIVPPPELPRAEPPAVAGPAAAAEPRAPATATPIPAPTVATDPRAQRLADALADANDPGRNPEAHAAIRDAMIADSDYEQLVELYERLADRDPWRRVGLRIEAARFAWHGLRDPARAVEIASRLGAADETASAFILEVAEATEEVDLRASVLERLAASDLPPRVPDLALRLAALAAGLGRHETVIALLSPIASPGEAMLQALDAALSRLGRHAERIDVLRALLDCIAARPESRAEAALAAARLARTAGDIERALSLTERGLGIVGNHRSLWRLRAELLEAREDWPELAAALERLADLAQLDDERARYLTRSAQVRLDHLSRAADPALRTRATTSARALLERACALAPQAELPRDVLLRLAFAQGRWDEVAQLGEVLRTIAGDDEELLVLAAVAEARARGRLVLAREIGFRHGPQTLARLLFPGLARVLAEIATAGPLPRLDAVLIACAHLAGGRVHMLEQMRAWASGQPIQPGLALGLARLHEADGSAELSRSLYQVAAFMAPRGPLPAFVARLPAVTVALDEAMIATAIGSSMLRMTLYRLRSAISATATAPALHPLAADHPAAAVVGDAAEAFSPVLGTRPALAVRTDVREAVTIVALSGRPLVLALGEDARRMGAAELRFRIGYAACGVATGSLVLASADDHTLGAFLDAIASLGNPGHVPTGPHAQAVADTLASHGARAAQLVPNERAALLDELAHWLAAPGGLGQLRSELRKTLLMLAVRVSGQLDGALWAVARDGGYLDRTGDAADGVDGSRGPLSTLRSDEAAWLLRAIGLY